MPLDPNPTVVVTADPAPMVPEQISESPAVTAVPLASSPTEADATAGDQETVGDNKGWGTPTVVLDDGRRFALDMTFLLGRDPARELRTCPVRIDDPDRSVSKNHCAVGIRDDGTAWVADRYSSNGTCVIDAAGTVHACPPGVAVSIPPGATVYIGERSFAVDGGR